MNSSSCAFAIPQSSLESDRNAELLETSRSNCKFVNELNSLTVQYKGCGLQDYNWRLFTRTTDWVQEQGSCSGGAQNQNEVHAAFGTRIEDIKKLISCECSLQRILVLAVSAATVV